MRVLACHLAIALWMGGDLGSWLDLHSQDAVFELSERLSKHGWGYFSSFRAKYAPITAPIYSSVFRVKVGCSSIENCCRHNVFDVRL